MDGYKKAILLLDKGIQTIPINEYKRPIVNFADIPIDRAYINYHWWKYKNTQVLAALCRGVWCIDIDVSHADGKNGFESLKSIPYYDELDNNAKETMLQVSPSGGLHIIFKKHEGIEYRQHIGYLDGVDIKAHDNNYFVLAGSRTKRGVYQHNGLTPLIYQGDFEERIFSELGSFRDQIIKRHSVKAVLPEYDFSHLDNGRRGGAGKAAYRRIVENASFDRNNDLFLAATYAKTYGLDLEPLRVLIGTVKDKDQFMEQEWLATVNSAGSRA